MMRTEPYNFIANKKPTKHRPKIKKRLNKNIVDKSCVIPLSVGVLFVFVYQSWKV